MAKLFSRFLYIGRATLCLKVPRSPDLIKSIVFLFFVLFSDITDEVRPGGGRDAKFS